jgi:hypothetical protein
MSEKKENEFEKYVIKPLEDRIEKLEKKIDLLWEFIGGMHESTTSGLQALEKDFEELDKQ